MDNVSEQLVVKKRTRSDYIKMTVTIIFMAVFSMAALIFGFFTGYILMTALGVGVIFFGIWTLGSIDVEYEYIITNNEMDIDKITGKRKRTRMITVDLSQTQEFGKYPSGREDDADATVIATSGVEKDACFLLAQHSQYGKVGVIFNPNKRTREAIAQEVPRALRARVEEYGK